MTIPSPLDWDTDEVKHFVRKDGWLPAATNQLQNCQAAGRPLKYLTFCAAQAIDVFMLLRSGVLQRDPETNCVLNTYFCEEKPEEFTRITELIGSHEQGFLGDFQEMILFEDDSETNGKSINDTRESYSRQVRDRLNVKDRHERFSAAAPFDLINLDICGRFFPPKGGVVSPIIRAISRLLELQGASCSNGQKLDEFTMFVTTHVEARGTNPEAVNKLVTMMESNRTKYAGFDESMTKRFGSISTIDIPSHDFNDFYNVAIPKMIIEMAYDLGWMVDLEFTGTYERSWPAHQGEEPAQYRMLALVARFTRITEGQLELGHQSSPLDVEYSKRVSLVVDTPVDEIGSDQQRVADVSSDLLEVVNYRTVFQNEILRRP